jgi:hypothetical protein
LVALSVLCGSAEARCPAWSERSEVYYDQRTRTLERRYVRACIEREDFADLELSWFSDRDSLRRPDGKVEGQGRLIWRRPGKAPYDARAIVSIYDGELERGRRHGTGRLETRFGTTYEGHWRDGLPGGTGVLRLSNGDEYHGRFQRGFPIGFGRLVRANGTTFVGPFGRDRCMGDDEQTTTPPTRGMICGLAE